jgi:cysteine synthase A
MTTIGNTPLVRLDRLHEAGSADIFVKWEGANPTGSMKDRMALSMIEGAEARGALKYPQGARLPGRSQRR